MASRVRQTYEPHGTVKYHEQDEISRLVPSQLEIARQEFGANVYANKSKG